MINARRSAHASLPATAEPKPGRLAIHQGVVQHNKKIRPMKIALALIIGILATASLFSQSQPDAFAIGDYIKVMESDSILI